VNTQFGVPATFVFAALLLLNAGCASTSTVSKVFEEPQYKNASFSNVLVIGVADDYDARAQFERQVVAGIRASGAGATAYYTVIGHNPAVTRSDVSNAIRSRNFDAVLMTRVKGQESSVSVKRGSSETKTTRRNENAFDLFRYDYEVLNEPDRVEVNTTVVLVTELYAAADEKKVWAIESSSFYKSDVSAIIDSEVDAIVSRLRRDRMIGR